MHIATSIPKNDNRRQDGEYIYVLEAVINGTPHTKEGTGYERCTTRNRLVLLALDDALGCLKDGADLAVYTDNQNIMFGIREGWIYRWKSDGFQRSQIKAGKKYFLPLENADLWERIYYKLDGHTLTWPDSPDSYLGWMREELHRREKEIMIEHYKRYT